MDGPKKPKTFKPKHAAKLDFRSFNGRAAIDRMYDHAWEKYRTVYLKINHQCYACPAPATVVDHLRPHKGDEKLFRQTDNHIPLCAKCHNTVTSLYDRNFKIGGSIKQKIEWFNWSRARNEVDIKVKVLPKYEV